jgi:hypothetical protein
VSDVVTRRGPLRAPLVWVDVAPSLMVGGRFCCCCCWGKQRLGEIAEPEAPVLWQRAGPDSCGVAGWLLGGRDALRHMLNTPRW